MSLSSLFDSLDRLDETDDDEEDFSGLYPLEPTSHTSFRPQKRKHIHTDVDENAESKRAKILVSTHASSTLQPRHSGTGVLLDRLEKHSSITVESSPTSSPRNSSSSGDLASSLVLSENNQKSKAALHEKTKPLPSKGLDQSSTGSGQGNIIIRVPQLTFSMANIHFMPAKASVADSAPIATCSRAGLSQANISKLVSQPAYKSSTVARPRVKDQQSAISPSNSFRDTGLVASRQDNHVAQGASGLFGAQITLVSRKSRHPAQSAQVRGTKDAKDQCTTIPEFASYLQTRSRDAENTNKKQKPIFHDLIVYYAAKFPGKKMSHSTKRRMEILSGLSAKVVGNFDSSVTHIVSDLPEKPLLEIIGLSSVDSIPPSVWVVGWTWVTKSINSSRRLEETPYERFHKRLVLDNRLSHAPRDNRRGMSVRIDDVTETGMCLAYSSEASLSEGFESGGGEHSASVSSGLSIRVSSAIHTEAPTDPLGSVVALARELTHGDFSSERSSSPEIPEPERLPQQKDATSTTRSKPCPRPHGSGFACMTGNATPAGPCVNQMLVDELSRLRDIYEAKKHEDPSNQFRVLNYTKGVFSLTSWADAIRSITKHPTKITSVDQVSHLAGVGTGIAEKINEFIATGRVAKIAAQTTEDLAVTQLFQGIYGVGPQTAHSWYVRGLRTLADIRNRMDGIVLSPAQELGLQYYTDLRRRMPRGEAAEIFRLIKAVALQFDPMLNIEIMGSFRRGKPTCGDIDILITRPTSDGKSHRGM
ncbi:unnamed protein product [Rhizoctonia solani]|uniref:DNA polymerase lambda n=1 Tax=Rhizoctonia solani TaxID=456999 RepID=A0A8H2W9V2_9AGAM|nr:unnamed protein product [Rhizoctonia solani]